MTSAERQNPSLFRRLNHAPSEIARRVGEFIAGDPPPYSLELPQGSDKRLTRMVRYAMRDAQELTKRLEFSFLETGADFDDLDLIEHYLIEIMTFAKIDKLSPDGDTRQTLKRTVSELTDDRITKGRELSVKANPDHVVYIDPQDYQRYLLCARNIAEKIFLLDSKKVPTEVYVKMLPIRFPLAKMQAIKSGDQNMRHFSSED